MDKGRINVVSSTNLEQIAHVTSDLSSFKQFVFCK